MEYRTPTGVLVIKNDALYIRTRVDEQDVDDNEIVSWNIDEVKEDPSLAFTSSNAVARFFLDGAEAVASSIGREITPDGNVRLRKPARVTAARRTHG